MQTIYVLLFLCHIGEIEPIFCFNFPSTFLETFTFVVLEPIEVSLFLYGTAVDRNIVSQSSEVASPWKSAELSSLYPQSNHFLSFLSPELVHLRNRCLDYIVYEILNITCLSIVLCYTYAHNMLLRT